MLSGATLVALRGEGGPAPPRTPEAWGGPPPPWAGLGLGLGLELGELGFGLGFRVRV